MLDDGKVLDLLAFFEENHFGVLLLAETGVCANTHLSHGLQEASDFTSCPHSLPGVGVGAIFAPALKNSWCVTQFKSNSCNFRAWLLSVAGSLLLLGAVYAPHSGHSTKDRLAFFALVWEEWKTLQSRHQDAQHLLLGDMNLPMLLRSGSVNSGCHTNSVEELFVSTFLANMTLLNNFLALPRSTHVKGNVLDLALINKVGALVGFEVLSVRVAASDHFPICVHIKLGPAQAQHKLRWSPFKELDANRLVQELDWPLRSLHAWLEHRLCHLVACESSLKSLLQLGACVFGIVVLGTLFRLDSPFGRFCSVRPVPRRRHLSRPLREAINKMRSKRGTSEYKAARKSVRRRVALENRLRADSLLKRSTKHGRMFLSKGIHKWIAEDLKHKASSSQLITVDGRVLDKSTAILLWKSFLESLTSWNGQVDPAILLKLLDGEILPDEVPALPSSKATFVHVTKQWLRDVRCEGLWSRLVSQFSWLELCDACASMNPLASPPPSEPLPSSLLCVCSTPLRSCLLALLNLCVLTAWVPEAWCTVVVTPLLKPGKSKDCIASHRPISLMPLALKLLDRLLYKRLWPSIRQQLIPWQQGGIGGADASFALVGDVLRLRKMGQIPFDSVVVFVDGQSAFCRPPALAVAHQLRKILHIQPVDVLLTFTLLSSLRSRAALFGEVHGKWHNETGLPQGGALSVGLFGLLTVPLFDSLVDGEVGLPSEFGLGPALCYVDDVALLLKDSFAAQSALDLTSSWARDLRLKLNVGDDKTAALCGPSGCPSPTPLSVDGVPLPWVTTYRYLGGLLHCAGSVRPMLKDLDLRLTKRTGMFVRWGRASQIAIAILAKLFIIYLEPVALSLLAAVPLNASDLVHIDMLQRKLARMVLGHSKRSPIPSPLLLLGWCSWSAMLPSLRAGLLLRAHSGLPSVLTQLCKLGPLCEGTWYYQASLDLHGMTGCEGIPPIHDHQKLVHASLARARELD